MVERTDYANVLRSASARRGTAGAIQGSRGSGVVRAKTLGIVVVGTRHRSLPFNSAFRTPHSALSYVYRASLPFGVFFSLWRLSPRADRAHCDADRLPRARAHLPLTALRHIDVLPRIATV